MNKLYGNQFIEKLVSSGYKSPIHAMAEIIDNSVDAKSSRIDITFVEQEKGKRKEISDVFFIDNGGGMSIDQINGCLRFADGAGTSNDRIGKFGVGLPNSSIFIGRRVEVYSKDKNTNLWNFVCLDLDEQATRTEPGYDSAVEKLPNFENENIFLDFDTNEITTIIRWSKIRNIGAKRAETVINKSSKLTGRLYRYGIDEGLKIYYSSILRGNKTYDIPFEETIPYDPLFVSTKKTYITDIIWNASRIDKPNKDIPDNPKFNQKTHYEQFVLGCKENETNLPLFQKFEDYWNVPHTLTLNNIDYTFSIKASFAYKSIAHPGIKKGGGTSVGKEFGKKMSGSKEFDSANIFFIRTKREIDCNNYKLYTVTDEKNRFWTIEIEFGPDLDDLMGVDYQKQHVEFKYIDNDDISGISFNDPNLSDTDQRLLLFNRISNEIKDCIKKIKKILTQYAREFKVEEKAAIGKANDEETTTVPAVEGAVINAMPQGREWNKEEIDEVVSFIRERFMHLDEESINNQVEKYAHGKTKTIVLYHANQSGKLFELNTVRGKKITFINTEHVYYKNIIEPLKNHNQLNIFTIAIEMLICSYAYEMDAMIQDDDKKEYILERQLNQISARLEEFIHEGQISVDTEKWSEIIETIDEEEETLVAP